MKKILLLTTIFSLFILSSCNKDPYIYESTNNTNNIKTPADTTQDTPTSSDPSSTYDDTLPWGDLH